MAVKTDEIQVGKTVRVVGIEWAKGIGQYRAKVNKIFTAYGVKWAVLRWIGGNADKLIQEYGTRFELENLRLS